MADISSIQMGSTEYTIKDAVARASIAAMGEKVFSVPISTTWTGSQAPYTQTVTVSGILASDNPVCDVDTSSATASTIDSIIQAWSSIHNITTADGSVTFKCFGSKPTKDITAILRVVR